MKVLLLGGAGSRNAGGVFEITAKLALALQRIKGTEVHVLLHNDEHTEVDRQHFGDVPLHLYTALGPRNFSYSRDVAGMIRSIAPDVVHIMGMWLYVGLVNLRYFAETKTPYIISPHGMLDPWQLNQSFVKNLSKKIALRLYERDNLNTAACIHALNRMEYDAIRQFGLKNPVTIIPNATQASQLPAAPANRRREKKRLLFLSRIHPKKGLDILLDGWAKARAGRQEWELVIAGDSASPKYWDELQCRVEQLGIGDSCRFIGGQFDEAKHDCFQSADAFILPSYSEGLPVAVLEAWSYGLPVIMTPFCYLPEGFEEHAAIEIPPTASGVCTGILELAGMTAEQRLAMGRNGARIVERKYSWEKVANSFHRAYRWIAGAGAATVRMDRNNCLSVDVTEKKPRVSDASVAP